MEEDAVFFTDCSNLRKSVFDLENNVPAELDDPYFDHK